MKKKFSVVCVALALTFSTLLTACGSKKNSNQSKENQGQTNNVVSTADGNDTQPEETTATQGGSIVVGITNDLDSLDPHKAVAAGTKEVLFNIFEGLVKPTSEGELVPAVASDYQISEDGKTYTFTLRDGVKFHNGQEVTVEDVIYSLKRSAGMLEEEDVDVKKVEALSIISEIKAVDDKNVEITLSESNTELLAYLTCAIIPKDYQDQTTNPVGTGPFKFVSYEPQQSFVMEKNQDYYGTPAYLDKVTFKISADANAAFMELQAGSIDIFPYLTQAQASQITGNYTVEIGSTNIVQALFLNNNVEPFTKKEVRQAMCYAVNRQGILDFVAGGNGSIIGSNIFPNFKKYYNEECENKYPYDVAKAKELLKEAGYPDGFKFTITVPSNYQFHVDTAQVIVEQLKQVGITAEIQLVEWASWLDDVYKERNYEATIVGLTADLAPSDLTARYQSDAGNNFFNYNNSQYDEVFKKAIATVNEDEKAELYKQLQTIVADDAANVYIQDPASMVAVNKKITGYQFYPLYVQDMSLIHYVDAAENH